jgi:hypothetical protein
VIVAVALVGAVAIAFVVYCLVDLARARVRRLDKLTWAVLICVTIPWGGLAYLIALLAAAIVLTRRDI